MYSVFMKRPQGQDGQDLVCLYQASNVSKADIALMSEAVKSKDSKTLKSILVKADSVTTNALWFNDFRSKFNTWQGTVGKGMVNGGGATVALGMLTFPVALAAGVVVTSPVPLAVPLLISGAGGILIAAGGHVVEYGTRQSTAFDNANQDSNYASLISTKDEVLKGIASVATKQAAAQAAYTNQSLNKTLCPSKESLMKNAVISW
jgi:hypothetical protein